MTVKVVTTLHEDGYNIYGSNLSTWAKFFPEEWQLEYYAENHKPNLDSRFVVKDFNQTCADWTDFYNYIKLQTININDNKKINWYKKALRWSFKMYTLLDSLKSTNQKYLIWLDSDVTAVSSRNTKWIANTLHNYCLAAKMEKIKGKSHIESGILIIDTEHSDTKKIIHWIEQGYIHKQILNEEKAWDGFWLAKLVETEKINWKNQNFFADKQWLIHHHGDDKFQSNYNSRSGRSKNNELI